MKVSVKRRFIDLSGMLLFVAFFVKFHTLVKVNLGDIQGTKEFAVCFVFPFAVFILAVVRFFSRKYMSSPFVFMFSKAGNWGEDDQETRFFSLFVSLLVTGLVLQLTSFALVDHGYMSPGYNAFEITLCTGFSFFALAVAGYIFYKNRKKTQIRPAFRIVALIAIGAAAWMFGSGLRAVYELFVFYPQLLR